jgi:oligopeptide transport system substrate-binding protein
MENQVMKKILSAFLVLSMCISVCCVLTSCGEPKDAGAEIAVYFGDTVYDFDPTDYYEDSNAKQLMSLLFEPLFKLNEKGKLEYGMAKSYSVDEEKNEIVIQLRESYWSDEVAVTADDFIYSWAEVTLEPNFPSPHAPLLYDIENALEINNGSESIYSFGAKATAANEITIKCREGANYDRLLKNLASVSTAPIRRDIHSQASTYWTKTLSVIVTNGPFLINSLDQATGEFTVARNRGYHQNPTVVDYVGMVTPGQLISFAAAGGEEINLTYSDVESKTVFYLGDASLEERKASRDKATFKDDLSTYSYVFNTEHPLFKNKNVRRALSLALNRAAMAEAVTFAVAADGFLPAKLNGGREGIISTSANLEEAKALIADADIKGISKSFTLTVNDDEASVAMANLAKAAWGELGFNVTVRALDTKKTLINDRITNSDITIYDSALQVLIKEASYGKRSFDVIGMNWQMYSLDSFVPLASFTTGMNGYGVDFSTSPYTKRLNITAWSSPDYDALLGKAYSASEESERESALLDAEKMLLENAPIVPVVYNQSFGFVSKDLSGVKFDGYSNFVFTKVKQKNYEQYLDD